MVEMELETGSGLERYKEGKLQCRVLNLASGEYGILRINKGKANAIWAGSLDTLRCWLLREVMWWRHSITGMKKLMGES